MSEAEYFEHDGLDFCFQKTGEGFPFVFLHGLGGNLSQPFGIFSPPPGIRLICLDARAHGRTRPLGAPEKVRISVMADDVGALMDHLGLPRAVVGGILMGAAVALNFALRFPARAAGLVLSRPAWLDAPRPENTRVFSEIAKLLRERGAKEGLEAFQQSEVYAELARDSADCAASACGQFFEPRAGEAVVRLEQIPWDQPCDSREDWRRLAMPALVMANRLDPIHPFEYGEILAGIIPGAEFGGLTPKSVSVEAHQRDNQRQLSKFLTDHFCKTSIP